MIAIILGNILHVKMANDVHYYARKMRILIPIMSSFMFVIFFTGVVMMAAKHLEFSIENIIMILFNVILIVLERKRYLPLKYLRIKEENAFDNYKIKAFKILTLELVGILLITLWMLVLK
jgi:hypothetical protein